MVEMEQGHQCFIGFKSIAQTEGKVLSYICKIGDVVWDEVLGGKEPTRE